MNPFLFRKVIRLMRARHKLQAFSATIDIKTQKDVDAKAFLAEIIRDINEIEISLYKLRVDNPLKVL